MFSDLVGNNLASASSFFVSMYCFSISRVVVLSFPFRPIVCLAPVMLTSPFWRLMSATLSQVSSMGLVPRSFDIDRMSAIRVPALDISMFSFSSVGILGSLS